MSVLMDTSLEAFEKIRPKLGRKQREVLDVIEAAPGGLTDWEIAQVLQKNHRQDVAPRRCELLRLNLIKDSGQRRFHAGTRCWGAVWILGTERNLL